MHADCKYCHPVELGLSTSVRHVADLETTRVFLLADQTQRGRCVVALKDHRTELFHLDDAQLQGFTREVAVVAAAIAQVTGCRKVNYAAYGDLASHLHFHVVPKSPGQPHWGEAFALANDPPVLLSEAEMAGLTDRIRVRLPAR